MPGISYTLSCFYRRRELVTRIGLCASVASLSGAFGGLLATAFTTIPPWGPINTWRNIFFFEGVISIILGVIAFFVLPSSPATASFLTAKERELAVKRIADDLKTQHIETLKKKYIKRAIWNPNAVLVAIASLCSLMSMNSMALFVPSLLNSIGYSGINSQLLSVPPYAWAAIVCVAASMVSDRTHRRGQWILAVMPFSVVGFAILLVPARVGVHYFALFLCLTGVFTASPMLLAWVVDNSAGHMTRAIVAGFTVGFGSTGGIIAAWTYLLADAPGYTKGHAVNLGFSCLCIVAVGLAIYYLNHENKLKRAGKRDYRLAGKSESEIQDLGHEHPEFKFSL
ncbi:hypothetical protein jhhlp_002666 [Lomentospora prolificans]|uniref:Major facilitator superfamily (MFS) profile domain-containing protein n=1 Tax=Lomentospora prolificans TaxID=41688 RepID=A0A2N3NEQ6_9PEZI|nr:hypothetical protein jhhlp_002666 [Lomentospora prolificans]